MKELKKISDVLGGSSKMEKRQVRLFDHIQGEKTQKLLKGVITENFRNDMEAARSVYDWPGKPEKPDKKFLMLKSRLRKKMVEEILLLNPHNKKRSPYESALNEAYRNLSIAKTLLSVGMRKEAMEIVRILYQEAQQYRLTEILLCTARMLRYNASLSGTVEDLILYDRVIGETRDELDAEMYSEKVMEELNLETRFSYSNRKDLLKRIYRRYSKLQALAARYKSHILRLNSFRIGIRYYEFMQDFKGMIGTCEAGEKYINDNPQFKQDARYAEMALFKMDACLHLQDYELGSKYASVCLMHFSRGYPNWFVFMEYYFLLSLQTGKYEAALEIFKEVTHHVRFRQVNPERKEKWRLFEAYLNFALPDDLADRNFKVNKFINEVPIYNRDKKGYNVSILIAQFILLLSRKDYDHLLSKRDSFKSYFSRHIRREYNYRSYYFFKMLMVAFRYDFNREKTDQIAQKFLVKLKSRNNRYHGDLESLEVIPYEQLWNEVVQLLKNYPDLPKSKVVAIRKKGRAKKKLSKNMQAALRYKALAKLEHMQEAEA
jgi:hypothetical protein